MLTEQKVNAFLEKHGHAMQPLRERLFLQDLSIAVEREAEMEKISHTVRITSRQASVPGCCDLCLASAYDALAKSAATVEAFLARRELCKQDQKERTLHKERTDG